MRNTPTNPSSGASILKNPNGEQSPYPTVKKVMALKYKFPNIFSKIPTELSIQVSILEAE